MAKESCNICGGSKMRTDPIDGTVQSDVPCQVCGARSAFEGDELLWLVGKEDSLKPEHLMEVIFDGDKSLRFLTLYGFLEEKDLQADFIEYVKKQHFEDCDTDVAGTEWERIVEETSQLALQLEKEENES